MIVKRDIEEAALRLKPFIHRTPVFSSSYLDKLIGASLFLKCENFQKTGSFKARGAMNAVLQLSSAEAKNGVCTHSSGNHGQALAWAASQRNIPAFIVMPENAPEVKVNAVRDYGAEIIFCEPTLQARERGLQKVMAARNAVFIPPYNFENTIAGQASCALEIFDELPEMDFLLTPVGGGGLLSGSALSAHFFSRKTAVIGCEPLEADDAYRSFHSGKIEAVKNSTTIADGLRTALGDIPFAYIRQYVNDILLCGEVEILQAQKLIMERMKIVVEPSSAVPLACILENPSRFRGKKVAIIISGGNVDW